MNTRPLAALIAALALASCGDDSPNSKAESVDEPRMTSAPRSTPGTFDPGEFGLRVMAYDEFSPLIEPGTGCSFQTARGELVFVATAEPGSTSKAKAVINPGDGARVLESDSAGYEALMEGGEFSGDGDFAVIIERQPGDGIPGEIETNSWPARLTLEGKDGAERVYDNGRYDCGA